MRSWSSLCLFGVVFDFHLCLIFMISELMLVSEFSGPLFDLARPDFCFMLQFCLWKNIWTCQHIHRGNTLAIRCLQCDFYFFHRLWHVEGASVVLVVVFFFFCVCVSVGMHACMLNVQNTCRHLSRQYFLRFSCKKKKSALHEFAGKKAKMFIVWTSYQKAWHIPLGKKSKVSQLSNIFCTELLHLTELYLWLYEFGLA